jgi:rhamnosyltransferase subunit B
MRTLITVIGSGGDLNPMLGIGKELSQRGHDVTLLAGSWQEPVVRKVGLQFHAIIGNEQMDQVRASLKSSPHMGGDWCAFFREAILPTAASICRRICDEADGSNTLLIGPSWILGMRLAAERCGVPLVSASLQLRPLTSDSDQEKYGLVFNRLFAPIVNRCRSRVGLPPIESPLNDWLASTDKAVTLVPEWFLNPETDAADQAQLSDFVMFDSNSGGDLSPQLQAFLRKYPRPVVFTFGTESYDIAWLFKPALNACRRLGLPAIFLTKHGDQVPELPDHVLRVDYVPLNLLLPHVAGIVYHGGIGTCAQALKAGVPQVVMPIAFDQFHTAAHVEHLGVGVRMTRRNYLGSLSSTLREMLANSAVSRRCLEISAKFASNSVQTCCDSILSLAFES